MMKERPVNKNEWSKTNERQANDGVALDKNDGRKVKEK